MKPDLKKKAKLEVLTDLQSQMEQLMGDGLKNGMTKKKVVIAADSNENLKKGLEKAEEMLPDNEEEESEEIESEEGEESSEEDIDAQIAALMAKKAKLKA